MRYGTTYWSWGRRLAPVMTMVLALSLCRTEAGEDQAVTVSPGTVANVTFSAEHTQPLWTLTVTPASGWAHKPETVSVNSSRWFIEDPGGGCEIAAFFECNTATQPAELQFQDRIFSGQLEPCTSSPGGSGGSPIPGWEVIGITSGDYFVLPQETNIWLGSSATFLAEDGCANPMLSSWSSTPSLGTLQDGYTLNVTPEFLGKYTIMGTDKNNSSLSDAGVLTAVVVDLKSVVFTSDHGVLRNYNDDFVGDGTQEYTPHGWVSGGSNNPISHTRDQNVSVNVTVCAKPPGVTIYIRGLNSTPGLGFDIRSFVSSGSDQTFNLTSSEKLLSMVDILNESIAWEASLPYGTAHSIGSSGPHKIYVTWGMVGAGPTRKRVQWVCNSAIGKGDSYAVAKAIFDHVPCNNGQITGDGWQILDGEHGECRQLADCMTVAVQMIGIPAATALVRGSSDAGSGHCLDPETLYCAYHDAYEPLLLNFGGVPNWYEGCCNTVGKFFAILPKTEADNDYLMLKALGCTQGYWVLLPNGQPGFTYHPLDIP